MADLGIHVHEVERVAGEVQVGIGGKRNDPGELHYVVHGPRDNPNKIMMVMGFTTDGANWYPQVDHFTAKGYTVVTFDNRGNGRSSGLDFWSMLNLRIYSMSLDALELLDHLGWNSRDTHLAGVSMGGMISLEMLARRTFRSAALIVTTGVSAAWMPLGGFVNVARGLLDPTLDSYQRALMNMELNFNRNWLESDSGFIHPKTNEMMTNQKWVLRNGAKIWYGKKNDGVHPDPSLKGMMGQAIACAMHHVSEKKLNRIRETGGPIMIIAATEDKMVRTNASKELAKILNPQEFLLIESGHAVNVQEREHVNQALDRFFDNIPQRSKI
mmetsp:Transcript_16916/g.20319  ORF Transcript_16916/g.20319 Transcript_16916/m.20319 type:complete len:327 (-) Transcript_16916:105-1085(-)